MSSGPTMPELSGRKFFDKPENWGMLIVIGAILVVVGVNALVIFNYIISLLTDMLHIALLAGELCGLGYLVFGKKPRIIFRALIRSLTNIFIHCYPIDIVKDHILQMKKKDQDFQQQISNVRGQISILERQIDKNAKEGMESMREAEQAKQMAAKRGGDPNDPYTLRMNLQMRSSASHAARLKQANDGYQNLLDKTRKVYDLLTKWDVHIQYLIEDTEDQVKQAEIQYKTVNAAYGALQKAKRLISGDAQEDDMFNQTMEFLAEDAGRKLGAIDDFQRVAETFMDKMDVKNGAIEADALDALSRYEQQALNPGNKDTAFLLGPAGAQSSAIPINRQAAATGTDDFNSLLK